MDAKLADLRETYERSIAFADELRKSLGPRRYGLSDDQDATDSDAAQAASIRPATAEPSLARATIAAPSDAMQAVSAGAADGDAAGAERSGAHGEWAHAAEADAHVGKEKRGLGATLKKFFTRSRHEKEHHQHGHEEHGHQEADRPEQQPHQPLPTSPAVSAQRPAPLFLQLDLPAPEERPRPRRRSSLHVLHVGAVSPMPGAAEPQSSVWTEARLSVLGALSPGDGLGQGAAGAALSPTPRAPSRTAAPGSAAAAAWAAPAPTGPRAPNVGQPGRRRASYISYTGLPPENLLREVMSGHPHESNAMPAFPSRRTLLAHASFGQLQLPALAADVHHRASGADHAPAHCSSPLGAHSPLSSGVQSNLRVSSRALPKVHSSQPAPDCPSTERLAWAASATSCDQQSASSSRLALAPDASTSMRSLGGGAQTPPPAPGSRPRRRMSLESVVVQSRTLYT